MAKNFPTNNDSMQLNKDSMQFNEATSQSATAPELPSPETTLSMIPNGTMADDTGPDALEQSVGNNQLKDRLADLQANAKMGWKKVVDRTEPFIRERPYAALGIAAAAGFVLSAVFLSRRKNA